MDEGPQFVKSLAEYFGRELISIPLIKQYPHQRCGLRGATLHLDMAAYPNIEYIAGNRLSIYPANPIEHVQTIMKHLTEASLPSNKEAEKSRQPPWVKFVQANGKDGVRLALTYLFELSRPPSRNLLKILADNCSLDEHKTRLQAICRTEATWQTWCCKTQTLRTLSSTLTEFNSCKLTSNCLFNELVPQQPRLYSISSIKSSRRFRTEIIVFQHKFAFPTLKVRRQLKSSSSHLSFRGSQLSSAKSATKSLKHQQVMSNTSLVESNVSQLLMKTPVAHKSSKFEGLCSTYLLGLNPNDRIICEIIENPSFTLKGNRERPILMIGQDVGVVAFRPFWQQRSLEYDRAQVFYTLFQDLSPTKFGDMQLMCITGNEIKIEDMFKREINSAITNKILSSVTYINRNHLVKLLEKANNNDHRKRLRQLPTRPTNGGSVSGSAGGATNLSGQFTDDRDLLELGNRIYKLLVDYNGCLYTCCDPQMTRAIEILIVESVARNSRLPRDRIMALLPKWKGRKMSEKSTSDNKFLFTLENPFERSQIVEEIYETSI